MMADRKVNVGISKASASRTDKPDPGRAVPVRVKKKTLKKLTNAEKLEADNKKMEDRLKQLRQTIEKEKKERQELNNQPFLWKSGQTGPVTNHAKAVSAKNKVNFKGDKIKVKFLSDTVESKADKKPVRSGTPHNTFKEGTTWAEVQRPRTPRTGVEMEANYPTQSPQNDDFDEIIEPLQRSNSIVGPTCGQCEINPANVNCVECGEKYCSDCFAVFHKKGALKSHRTRPLTRMVPINSVEMMPPKTPIPENSLWGEYNEEDSALSFADALNSWRGVDTDTTKTGNTNTVQENNKMQGNTTDGCQTSQATMPEIKFTENQDLTYMEKMMLKKQKHEVSSESDRFDTMSSPGDITISQLDYCRDLLQYNMETDEGIVDDDDISSEENNNIVIEEVNAAIGYLEEESECLIDDDVIDNDPDDDIEHDMAIARQLLTSVRIEEFVNTPIPDAGKHDSLDIHIDPIVDSFNIQKVACENSTTGSANTPPKNITSVETNVKNPVEQFALTRRPQTPPIRGPQTPIKVQDIEQPTPPRTPHSRAGRYTTTPLSPLVKRIPNIERQNTLPIQSSQQPQKHNFYQNRPATADVVILTSQAWKHSFTGFLYAGLPGYQLTNENKAESKVSILEEKAQDIMLGGPSCWCPGESHTDNEIFQSRENTISFSAAEQESQKENKKPDDENCEKKGNIFPDDVGNDNLEYDSESVLADLSNELEVNPSKSCDLGDVMHSIRNGTPEPLSLLSHDDRMSQLDMESRGISPTVTPLITKITTRESLFDDFEEVEKQIMEEDDYMIK